MHSFMYGPKDGSVVPPMLWALDVIQLKHISPDGATNWYYYQLDEESHDWIFREEVDGNDER